MTPNPGIRRRGIARRLMEAALADAVDREVRLWVAPDNLAAVRLYESLGFHLTEERRGVEMEMERGSGT